MSCSSGFSRCGCDDCWCRGPEVVADHLDACFCDQALSGQGWDALQQEMLSAMRHISSAEDVWIWQGDLDDTAAKENARQHTLAASANLLNISSMVEAMRRGKR